MELLLDPRELEPRVLELVPWLKLLELG